jgi:hypothetical protein
MADETNAAAFVQKEFEPLTKIRNKEEKKIVFATDADTSLRDFYYYNRNADANYQQQQREAAVTVDKENKGKWAGKNFYELSITNKGGMVMPIIVEWTFKDGTKEIDYVPVSIWKLNEQKVTKTFVKDKEVVAIRLDPNKETADIDESNNLWPVREMPSRFTLFTQQGGGRGARGQSTGTNSMQRAQKKN